MHPVAHIILRKLLQREGLTLPGVGTLHITVSGAAIGQNGVIAPPHYDILFDNGDFSAEPLESLISSYYDTSAQNANRIYNDWYATALAENNILLIENVAEIDLDQGSITIYEEFGKMLNPSSGNPAIVAGSRQPSAPKRLRPPKKRTSGAVTAIIIIGGIAAFTYILYYLATHTGIFDDILKTIR